MARTDAEILGRDDVNDLDAILAITNTDVDEVVHTVKDTPTRCSRGTTSVRARPS